MDGPTSPKGDMEGKDGLNLNCCQEPAKVALPSAPKTESWAHVCLCPDLLAKELGASPWSLLSPGFLICAMMIMTSFRWPWYLAGGWDILSEVTRGLIGPQGQLELTCFPPQRTSCQPLSALGKQAPPAVSEQPPAPSRGHPKMLLRARLSLPSVTAVQAVGGEPDWPKTMAAASMPTPQLPANQSCPTS